MYFVRPMSNYFVEFNQTSYLKECADLKKEYTNIIVQQTPQKEKANWVEPDRVMASIVKIEAIVPIAGADAIELAKILGWQAVVKKNEFKVNDLAIYFCIDSVLDIENPVLAFMAATKGRLKTTKKCGVLSQGLVGPLSWLSSLAKYSDDDLSALKEGDDVTSLTGTKKYVSPEEMEQYGSEAVSSEAVSSEAVSGATGVCTKRPIPSCICKTDEPRIQNIKCVLNELADRTITVTRKEDGTSATYYFDGTTFYVCGRNYVWTPEDKEGQAHFAMAAKYSIEHGMKLLGKPIAIQGEIVGPKIGGNKLKLASCEFRVFNIWKPDEQMYMEWIDVKQICATLGLQTVPELELPRNFEFTVDNLLEFANGLTYGQGLPAEGIVVKTNYVNCSRISFKVISNTFLLKHK